MDRHALFLISASGMHGARLTRARKKRSQNLPTSIRVHRVPTSGTSKLSTNLPHDNTMVDMYASAIQTKQSRD